MDSVINYKHIDEIKNRIPEIFYRALLGELISVFGVGFYLSYSSDGEVVYDFDSGTAGWAVAVYMACNKLDMMWLFEEWNSLPWYDSDTMDGEIEEELAKIVKARQDTKDDSYYLYLLSKMSADPITDKKG